jgi:hypothetical protein
MYDVLKLLSQGLLKTALTTARNGLRTTALIRNLATVPGNIYSFRALRSIIRSLKQAIVLSDNGSPYAKIHLEEGKQGDTNSVGI